MRIQVEDYYLGNYYSGKLLPYYKLIRSSIYSFSFKSFQSKH